MAATESSESSPRQNQLLASLPALELECLSSHLELVPMLLGDVLQEPGNHVQFAYFPTSSIISLHFVMENGSSAEVAGVGNEGVLGVSVFMGGDSTPNRALVQTAGLAYRLQSKQLIDAFNRSGPTLRLLLRYSQALITEIAQTVACNRHHSVEQQLCRWLLLTLDRLPSNNLVMTQELIASMLGVRRESVTEAAVMLKQRGVISYRRGHITVLNRSGLNAHVCECYQVVKTEFSRLLRDFRHH